MHKINEDEEENWEFHSTHPTEETLCFTVAGFNLQRICKMTSFLRIAFDPFIWDLSLCQL
jgi:hypothetical protein